MNSKTGSLKPKTFTVKASIIHPKSKSYTEAYGTLKWEETMRKEFQALIDKDTWEFVPYPDDAYPIVTNGFTKTKLLLDGLLDKYKAQIVPKE